MDDEIIIKKKKNKNYKNLFLSIAAVVLFVEIVFIASYSIFNYTKTHEANVIETSDVNFRFIDNNQGLVIDNSTPTALEDVDSSYELTFDIESHTTVPNGIKYRVYAIYGDSVTGKTRLMDDVVSVQFIPPTDGDGFTTAINNYDTPKSLSFVNGKALISTGSVKNTQELTTKTYAVRMWIDSSKMFISSTTKRATLAEGNPSLADTSSGTTTAGRYIKNDSNLVTTTLYPAVSEAEGKIVYTTNEFKNSYYSIKIVVEAEDARANRELVYLDANGGTISNDTLTVQVGATYGTLPEPQRAGYTFLGWNGKNMFNKNDIDNGHFIVAATGNLSSQSGADSLDAWASSNMISVKPSTAYIKSGNIGGATQDYFDINGDFISFSSVSFGTSFTTPANCYFVKFNLDRTNSPYNDIQLEEGSTATTYEPYLLTSSTIVTQEKDHVLTAIWQKNNS